MSDNQAENQGPGGPVIMDLLLEEQLKLHTQSLLWLPFVESAFFLSLSLTLLPSVPLGFYLTWGGCAMAINLMRAGLAIRSRDGTLTSSPSQQHLYFNLLSWASGATYGLGAASVLHFLPEQHLLLFAGTMYVLPAIGLMVAKASRRSILGYAIFLVTPIAYEMIMRYPEYGGMLPLFVVIYLAALYMATANTEQVLRRILHISREKKESLRHLEARNQAVNRAMTKAQNAAESRTRVLASASHDLRQPLHALATYTAVLESDTSAATLKHIGEKLDLIIEALSLQLQRLLELSQLIAGQVQAHHQTVRLDELLSALCEEYAPRAQAKGLRIEQHLDPCSVETDPELFRSMTRALLDNALNFTPSGTISIALLATQDGRACTLSVRDTGIGIDPADTENIFEEYFQVHNQARNRHLGVGLGLAIAQRQCALIGSQITVASRPGEGSRFQVALPLTLREPSPGLVESTPTGQQDPESSRHPAGMSATDLAKELSSDSAPLVKAEYIHLHARALSRLPGVHAVILGSLSILLIRYDTPAYLAGWLTLILVTDLLRSSLGQKVANMAKEGMPVASYYLPFALLALLSGSAIAVGWALQASNLPPAVLVFSATVLIIQPPIGVTLTQAPRLIQMAYTLPIFVVVGTILTRSAPEVYFPLLPILLTFGTIIIFLAALDVENSMTRAVKLRRELGIVMAQLRHSNEEIVRATDRAKQASQIRVRALASASHDLRQPLNALSLCNAVLVTRPSPERLTQVIGNVRKIVRSLGGLLHNLLDLSHTDTGNPLLHTETTDVDKVIAEVCAEFRASIEARNIQFDVRLAPICLQADPMALGRIVRNLIDNARKYTECGRISVSCHVDEGLKPPHAIIEISDTGQGIPEARQGQIFEEYFQMAGPGAVGRSGIGLGLSIVKSLSVLMDGDVEVESEPGKGSTFRVRLPVNDARTAAVLTPGRLQSPSLRGQTVLVVDDDVHIADSMGMLLNVWGLDCRVAMNAEEAEQSIVRDGLPALMLMDLRMPGHENGAQLAKRLISRHGPSKVIVVTGETAGPSVTDALDQGYALLKKPIMSDALRKAIQAAF